MQDGSASVDDMTSFGLEDFGLTEADLRAYNKTQEAQRAYVETEGLQPLPTGLADRLTQLSGQPGDELNVAEREQVLDELEAAMLTNLQASTTSAN